MARRVIAMPLTMTMLVGRCISHGEGVL